MGRPFEKFPPGARAHLESMACNGLLSESTAATSLGMPLAQFRQVVRDHAPSRLVWDNALAIERDQLLKALYDKAVQGDVNAAKILLATRHGMSEKSPVGAQERVQIVFHLPASLSPADYAKQLQPTVQQIGHDDEPDAA